MSFWGSLETWSSCFWLAHRSRVLLWLVVWGPAWETGMQLAGLVEAPMPQAEGMQMSPGRSALAAAGSAESSARQPLAAWLHGGGCAESLRCPRVIALALLLAGAEELESCRVPPVVCMSPASFFQCLLSSMGWWRAPGFPSASGGVAAFPSAGGCAEPQPPRVCRAACDAVESS